MNRRTLFLFAVVLLAISGALFWSFRTPSAPDRSQTETHRTRFTNPHFVGYHEGVRQWSLEANLIEEDGPDNPGVLLLREITQGVLYREGEEYLTFHADRGVWRPERSQLELEGDVRFHEDGELLLSSEKVMWYGSDERLVSPVRVLAYYDGQRVEADRLEVESVEDTVKLSGNVLWTNPDGIQVRAESALYTGDELVFEGLLEPVRFELDQGGDTP